MSKYEVSVTVQYFYEVEAESTEAAEEMGWQYEDYPYAAEVYSIEVEELEDEEDEDGED